MIDLDINLIGWFAVGLAREIKRGQNKCIIVANKSYLLSRVMSGYLSINGNNGEICEQNDIIFIWHHPTKQPPSWYLPVLNQQGWTSFLHQELIARTHPQEVYENSIDVTHFSIVHDFRALQVLEDPVFLNHMMLVKHRIKRKTISLFSSKMLAADFEVRLYGMGCAYNVISVPPLGLSVRMFALTTPTKMGQVSIRIAVSIKINNYLKKLVIPLIHRKIFKNIVNDFSQDVKIWENKCYREKPLLVRGDGQIYQFRQWCKQFYYEGMPND